MNASLISCCFVNHCLRKRKYFISRHLFISQDKSSKSSVSVKVVRWVISPECRPEQCYMKAVYFPRSYEIPSWACQQDPKEYRALYQSVSLAAEVGRSFSLLTANNFWGSILDFLSGFTPIASFSVFGSGRKFQNQGFPSSK